MQKLVFAYPAILLADFSLRYSIFHAYLRFHTDFRDAYHPDNRRIEHAFMRDRNGLTIAFRIHGFAARITPDEIFAPHIGTFVGERVGRVNERACDRKDHKLYY